MERATRIKLIRFGVLAPLVVTTFMSFTWRRLFPRETIGRAVVHVYSRSPELAVLPLPATWRARHGMTQHDQCIVAIDASSPRFMACANSYGPKSESENSEAAMASQIAALHSYPGESVSTDVRSTPSGPMYRVTRVFPTSATFHVAHSGTVVVQQFVRRIGGGKFLELTFYEDATQRATLDPIVWDCAEHAEMTVEQ